ncbi:plastocyanin/azurin family copper-binding protein [Paenibacillus cremeus]|uniref:Blue (type 1) copper domain-containing protein n=1 Tax=Paenibacillus cremeus TaxID=2163881 RepID=A0A559KBM9_9BACL|nr:plastocyanin/azurin family copper-binding protein [Paenibacillus cremeus]TVY09534.1 hypothetical protein FPZ49_12365 [Paenibacillus cremeus]
MNKRNKTASLLIAGAITLSGALPAWAADQPTTAAPAATAASVKTDVQVAADLGVIQGDGNGVTDSYLAKATTRLQAAILFLRLKGLEAEALAYMGPGMGDNFSDAKLVSESNQMVLGYLKANPQLGWTGTGNGKFEPMAQITAQQYYKVLLESLGYKQDTDFTYDNVLTYAKTVGLGQVAKAGALRNGHIASATVEALKLKVKGGTATLLDSLVQSKVVSADKAALAKVSAIKIASDATLGSFLTDEAGKTLYLYTKDSTNVSTCKDQCAVNWPIYYAESLQVPAELKAEDFKTIVREDGKKQTTYKGIPLYYFVKDEKAGDTKGQGVNNVWYVINHSGVGVASQDALGKFLVDSRGKSLYLYTKDNKDVSVCKGKCEDAWPIFYTENLKDTADLKAADFGTIVREDGTKQTTYKGWPLYYYVKDVKAGDVTGQGVGNVWYVIDPTTAKTAAPVQTAAKEYQVSMTGFAFSEKELTVEVGSKVTFTNMDPAKHNVVSDALNADGKPLFELPLLAKGESGSLVFDKPGTYTYYCMPHKNMMKATIIVK